MFRKSINTAKEDRLIKEKLRKMERKKAGDQGKLRI